MKKFMEHKNGVESQPAQKLDEASVTEFENIGANNQKTVNAIQKQIGLRPVEFFEGIHGIVAMFDHKTSPNMGVRLVLDDIKKLSRMDIRWLENTSNGFLAVGLPNPKR